MMSQPFASEQAYLAALLASVNRRLSALEAPGEIGTLPAQVEEQSLRARCQATVDGGGFTSLEHLFRTFSLTDFERHCVSLSLAAELDSRFEDRYAALQGGLNRLPSLELCLQTFTADELHRLALLAQWRRRESTLTRFFSAGRPGGGQQSDLTVGLKLDRYIVSFACDFRSADPSLEGITVIHWPHTSPPPLILRQDMLTRMTGYAEALPPKTPLLFLLRGEAGAGRRTLARHFCLRRGLPLLIADLSAILQTGDGWGHLLRVVCREAAIRRAALAFTGCELLFPEDAPLPKVEDDPMPQLNQREGWKRNLRYLLRETAKVTHTLFFLSTVSWQPDQSSQSWLRVELDLDTPDTGQRIHLWTGALEGLSVAENVRLETLAAKFAFQPGQIHAAVQEAVRLNQWAHETALSSDTLHQACRAQLSHSLGSSATCIRAAYTWEDLILPPEQKRQLQNGCAQVEYRHQVYETWGFGKKVAYGRGVSMLFSGPPGTGKTMAAQVVANRLGLELYKVDLSGVMSKYIGETEKQLGAVFDQVKKSQSILFFDEADALFGKRSETKDAHDRYANVQTSYLLQKIEEYDGIVILASNFLENFDEAFKRRIKFIIEFTLPDRERREQIWRSVLPPELPLNEDIDFDFLARSFELSGSSIKNIAVSAAFLAAEKGVPPGMVHLLLATQAEQNKSGRSLSREDFGEYYNPICAYQKSTLNRR